MTWAEIGKLAIQLVVGGGVGGGLVALLLIGVQKRKIVSESGKTDAEADTVLADAYSRRAAAQVNLIGPYERIQTRMQEQLDEANEKIDRLTTYVETLVDIIRDAGLAVPAMPKAPPVTSPPVTGGRRRRK